MFRLIILFSKESRYQVGKVVESLYSSLAEIFSILLFIIGLLITCLITSMLAFSLSTITFVKEMVHQSISAHQKSNAFLTEGKIVQVF